MGIIKADTLEAELNVLILIVWTGCVTGFFGILPVSGHMIGRIFWMYFFKLTAVWQYANQRLNKNETTQLFSSFILE